MKNSIVIRMIFLDYIYNKVYAPVEDDFGFDDAGDMDELDDELQMEEENAASGEGGDELYEHWKVQVDANQDPVRIFHAGYSLRYDEFCGIRYFVAE